MKIKEEVKEKDKEENKKMIVITRAISLRLKSRIYMITYHEGYL